MIEQLITAARDGVEARRSRVPQADLESQLTGRGEDRPFSEALVRPGLSLIAEFKRRSPSAGEIVAAAAAVDEQVGAYERGGAAALSVLTDETHFGGTLEDLRAARAACDLPILRKDFMVDSYQLYEAAVNGADAVLLIVRALDDELLRALYEEARGLDLDCLVEVHDERELERALLLDADVIGINNRNLDEGGVDVSTTYELMPDVPAGKTVVAESGISERAELEELERVGVDAVLIGSALMAASDPEAKARELAEILETLSRSLERPDRRPALSCGDEEILRTSFGSALLGGAVVGAFGWIAIAAGWIESDVEPAPAAAPAALAAPVASHSDSGEANTVNEIYKHDGQGVAFIQATEPAQEASPFDPFGESGGGGVATGSGFVIDSDGHLLTNNHVVEGASKIEVKLGSSEKSYTAKVVGTDPSTDVALLKVDVPSDQLHPLALGNSSKVEVGDPVVAIGNPFGLDRTVTSGIVSALQRQIEAPAGFSISHVIQTDAAINPGNSGGPLIDSEGRVIGINSQIETGGGGNGNVGIGFAIPIDTAREVAQQIEATGKVQHAYLGIEGGSITPQLAKALNLPVEKGVLVASVAKDGPADKAGIEGGDTSATIEGAEVTLGGDIITKLDGEEIAAMDDLVEAIDSKKPGEDLEVTILRGGDEKTVTVTLGNRPASVE